MCVFWVAGQLAIADQPVVIAHRGASGYVPEHTLVAKAMAFAMGADYIEQDLVLSKDAVPVVLHDIHLDTVTDVAERFPGRQRADGRFYALDFTLAEMKQLSVTERVNAKTREAVFPARFPAGYTTLQIPSLKEELDLIAGLNKSTGRSVGIYPEIKSPQWHLQQGVDLSRAVLDELHRYGYRTKEDPCWLQCFEMQEVKRLRMELGWQGRLVQLMAGGGKNGDGTDYAYLRSRDGLAEIAKLVDGIGPDISSIIKGKNSQQRHLTTLVVDAHAAGLEVHPYTARSDALPNSVSSLDELHEVLFSQVGVDGLFTDFPDQTAQFLHEKYQPGVSK
jgi:glycerophosphoryl diester phosphodiesterase